MSEAWTMKASDDAITIIDENGLTVATLGPSGGADARAIIAGQIAMGAALALVRAYNWGEGNGGSVDWDDVDVAHEAAREAIEANKEDPDLLGRVVCHACKAWTDERLANCQVCDAHLKGSEQPGNGDDE